MFSQILAGTRNNFVTGLADFGTQTEKGARPCSRVFIRLAHIDFSLPQQRCKPLQHDCTKIQLLACIVMRKKGKYRLQKWSDKTNAMQ